MRIGIFSFRAFDRRLACLAVPISSGVRQGGGGRICPPAGRVRLNTPAGRGLTPPSKSRERKRKKKTEVLTHATDVNGWFPAVYMIASVKISVCFTYRIYPFETFEFFCSCIWGSMILSVHDIKRPSLRSGRSTHVGLLIMASGRSKPISSSKVTLLYYYMTLL